MCHLQSKDESVIELMCVVLQSKDESVIELMCSQRMKV